MHDSAGDAEFWEPSAALLDTSFLAGGHFDEGKIKWLAKRLASRGVKLWIPQQVIYEWAIHAAEALTSLRLAQEKLLGTGILDGEIQEKTPAELVEHIQARCVAIDNVVIQAMNGESAAAAIRDQILGEGAGGVSKDGVRTGSVDSSIVRDAVRLVDRDLNELVFLTGNVRDFAKAVDHLGLSGFRYATSIKLLFKKLRPPTRDEQPLPAWWDALAVIAASLARDMREAADADDRPGPPPAWIEVSDLKSVDLDSSERRDVEELVERHYEVAPFVRLVGVRDISVEADGDTEIVSYTVILLADVEVVGAVFDNDGHTVYTSTVLNDRLITADYEATLKDGELGSANQTGWATAESSVIRVDDSGEAYEWLRSTLDGWCGIQVVEASDDTRGFPKPFIVRMPTGREDVAEAVPSLDSEWTLGFTESGVEVSAVYDPNARAWLGREDSFDRYPPVSLQSGFGTVVTAEPYSAIGKVWVHLVAPEG